MPPSEPDHFMASGVSETPVGQGKTSAVSAAPGMGSTDGPRWFRSGRLIDFIVVTALTAIAFAARVGGLAPSSLWLDDAWVGYVSKSSYADIPLMGLTAPGFLAIQKLWFDLVGFSEMKAQMLPFLASTLTPAATYLVLKTAIRKELAVAAGFIVALASLNVKYSYHVKQYTIEVLAGVLMFFLASRWLAEPSRRRMWALVGMICVLAAISFPVIVIATGPIAVIAVRSARDGRARIIETAPPLVVLILFVTSWYFGVIEPNATDRLRRYWGQFYLETGGTVIDLIASLQDRTWQMFGSLTPFPPTIVAAVCTVTFIAAFARRFDWAVMATVPLVAAAVLAGMQKVPLGGGRTDMYLLVPLLFGFIVGVDALIEICDEQLKRHQMADGVRALAAASASLLVGLAAAAYETPAPYPQEDIRPLIRELESLQSDDDAVLVYYNSSWAYALYADVESEPLERGGASYRLHFDEANLVVQNSHRRETTDYYLQYAEEAAEQSDRVWLVASHVCGCDWGEIQRQLRDDLGLELEYDEKRKGASLQLWVVAGT